MPGRRSKRKGNVKPNLSNFKFDRSGKFLGGLGTKDIYRDEQNREYIFKYATPKYGATGFEPWRIHAQLTSSYLTGLLKPEASIPVYEAEFDGVPGTLQPRLFASALDLGHAGGFTGLTAQALMDIAREHIADWIGSQHDSHEGQWVVHIPSSARDVLDYRLVCTDKEQGYKYFGRDQLSTDYHPNAVYGERPPIYNAFWSAWANHDFGLDMTDFFDSFEVLHTQEARQGYEELLIGYAKSCPKGFGRDTAFVGAAMDRYQTAHIQFREFLQQLRKDAK